MPQVLHSIPFLWIFFHKKNYFQIARKTKLKNTSLDDYITGVESIFKILLI